MSQLSDLQYEPPQCMIFAIVCILACTRLTRTDAFLQPQVACAATPQSLDTSQFLPPFVFPFHDHVVSDACQLYSSIGTSTINLRTSANFTVLLMVWPYVRVQEFLEKMNLNIIIMMCTLLNSSFFVMIFLVFYY